MKQWKCPNCKRDKETEDNIITVQCKCGEWFEEVKHDR